MSRLPRARGLKLLFADVCDAYEASRLPRARGLKQCYDGQNLARAGRASRGRVD